VSDRRLRNLEQAAMLGDVEAKQALIAERIRTVDLPTSQVKFAAHLGDEFSQSLIDHTSYIVKCGSCNIQYHNYCYVCKGAGEVAVNKGLVAAVRMVCPSDISLSLVGNWACDCVSRVLSSQSQASGYPQLIPRIVEEVRKWTSDMGNTSSTLQALQSDHSGMRGLADFYVVALNELVQATARHSPKNSACRFAQAVSFAYHATGHQRAERDWQIQHLIDLLLS